MPDKVLKTILIVDDDQFSQVALSLFLKRKFSVVICDNAEKFSGILSTQKIDLILMDITLRGNKNGLDLTRELRQDKLHNNIPVICLTAHSRKADEKNAMDAGADLFVTKPVRNARLLELIDECLQK